MMGPPSDPPSSFLKVVLLVVLDIPHSRVVDRVEAQTLNRTGAEGAAGEVLVDIAVEGVAAGPGDRADYAAQRAAVFGGDAAGLDLDFLQILENGILTRPPLSTLL